MGRSKPPHLTFEGVTQVDVGLTQIEPTVRGARPVPLVEFRFISVEGDQLVARASAHDAAFALDQLSSTLRTIVPRLGAKRGSAASRGVPAVANRVRNTSYLSELVRIGVTTVRVGRGGELSRNLLGLEPEWRDGEPPFVRLDVYPHAASFLLDIYAAADLRDRVFAVLNASLPGPGPTDREIRIAGGRDN